MITEIKAPSIGIDVVVAWPIYDVSFAGPSGNPLSLETTVADGRFWNNSGIRNDLIRDTVHQWCTPKVGYPLNGRSAIIPVVRINRPKRWRLRVEAIL